MGAKAYPSGKSTGTLAKKAKASKKAGPSKVRYSKPANKYGVIKKAK